MAEFLNSMVDTGLDNMLGCGDILRKRDKLKEKCEALEWGNVEAEKELVVLQGKDESVKFLQEEVDWYNYLSILAGQIKKLTVSLVDVEESRKKVYEEVAEACRAFEAGQKVLQQKKDDRINALKGIEKELAVARQRSQESLKQAMEVVSRVLNQMLEQEREFCLSLYIFVDQLNPFIEVLR